MKVWEMGNLPLRGKKMADQSAVVYRVEYAQIVHRFSTLTQIDCEKFVRLTAYIPGSSGDGLSQQEIRGVLPKGFGIWAGGAVRADKRLQDGWTTTQN